MKRSKICQTELSTAQYVALLFAMLVALGAFSQNKYPFDVKISGTGTTDIILMPGLSCAGDVWNETVTHYKKEYKCHILTMHGFAGSKADSTTSYRNWEKGIANYVTENKLVKPIFIGHSIGGGMAMLLASDYPDMFSKVIVVDALPCLGALSTNSFTANQHPDCSMFVKQFESMSAEQFASMQKQSMPTMMADTIHLAQAIQWSIDSDRKATAEIYCQFLNTDQRTTLANIKCPTLVLLEAPFASMKPAIEEQFENLKTGHLQYSEKALHFVMYDDTDWYFKQIDAFLK